MSVIKNCLTVSLERKNHLFNFLLNERTICLTKNYLQDYSKQIKELK